MPCSAAHGSNSFVPYAYASVCDIEMNLNKLHYSKCQAVAVIARGWGIYSLASHDFEPVPVAPP